MGFHLCSWHLPALFSYTHSASAAPEQPPPTNPNTHTLTCAHTLPPQVTCPGHPCAWKALPRSSCSSWSPVFRSLSSGLLWPLKKSSSSLSLRHLPLSGCKLYLFSVSLPCCSVCSPWAATWSWSLAYPWRLACRTHSVLIEGVNSWITGGYYGRKAHIGQRHNLVFLFLFFSP